MIREVPASSWGSQGSGWVRVRRGSVVSGVVAHGYEGRLVVEDDYDPAVNCTDARRWVCVLREGDDVPRDVRYVGSYVEPDGEAAHVYVGHEVSS